MILGMRKMSWLLLVWCALVLVWAIGGVAGNDCGSEVTELNRSACEAGTGIGVALIMFVGFIGFVFFSLIWLMTRPKGRDCPACGEKAKKGVRVCKDCGFDFAAAAIGGPHAAEAAEAVATSE